MAWFHLSQAPYVPGTATVKATLAANQTRGHHFIAQTEQRQHAFNPQVNSQNQNVYRWPKSAFRQPETGRAAPDSVNIENNLEAHDLYTLSFLDDSTRQYNLEPWFKRYESTYEADCDGLRRWQGPPDADAIKALVAVLKLKWLGVLRNPHNINHPLSRDCLGRLTAQHSVAQQVFLQQLQQRPAPSMAPLLSVFGVTQTDYLTWLAQLFTILSDALAEASLFERGMNALLSHPAVHFELYRDHAPQHCCLFNDRGFCQQYSPRQYSIGFNLSADMFLIMHIDGASWQQWTVPVSGSLKPMAPKIGLFESDLGQRQLANRLMANQAREHVYGCSQQRADY